MSVSDDQRNASECLSAEENIKVESDATAGDVKQGRRSSSISDRTHNNGSCDNGGGGELFEDMPEVFCCLAEEGGFSGFGIANKTNKLQQIIEDSISSDSKQTVSGILDQVNGLSTAEKLLLYLRLPSSKSQPLDPLRQPLNPLGSRFEIHQTVTWIKTHLEEDQDVSLPKQDVYEEYTAYCSNNNMKPLSTADFGKVMKQVFPSVRPRRLGTRGNSRYCYAGMRKRTSLQVPLLPDLAGDCTKANGTSCTDDEAMSAASCLVREWAEKLLAVKFDSLQDLACHLVENLCVDSRSVAAFTLLSALEPSHQAVAESISPLLQPGGKQATKHRETQLQLQRKLQEREVIREQKRKLQVHQQPSGRSSSASDAKPRAKRPKLCRQDSTEDVKPGVNLTTLAVNDSQEAAQLAPFTTSRPPSNCDKKLGIISASAAKPFVNGNEEFVDYSTICIEKKPIEGATRAENRVGKTCKIVNGCNNNVECQDLMNTSGNGSAFSNRFAVKSRHLSLDYETPDKEPSSDGRLPHTPVNEKSSSVDLPRSSLRFYLERSPTKKPDETSPEMDLGTGDLLPSLLQSQQVGPPMRPVGTVATHRNSPLVCSPGTATQSPQNVGKVLIPRLAKPRRETPPTNVIIFPPAPVGANSPKLKYKPIQPKVDIAATTRSDEGDGEPGTPAMGKEGSAFFPPNVKKSPAKQRSPGTKSNQLKQSPKKPRTPKSGAASRKTNKTSNNNVAPPPTVIPPRTRNEVSIGCLEKDALDDYLHGGSNSQEQEEELLQYFQNNNNDSPLNTGPGDEPRLDPVVTSAATAPADTKCDKLSQLRLLLERNLTSTTAGGRVPQDNPHSASQSLSLLSQRRQMSQQQQPPGLLLPSLRHAANTDVTGVFQPCLGSRRRVSFETSAADHAVPQSPNTRRRIFSFTPISPGPHSPLGRMPPTSSKPSSANASPFVSPRNTPVPRSRNNSTQSKSQQMASYLASMLTGGAQTVAGTTQRQSLGPSPLMADASGPPIARNLASFAGQSLNSLMGNGEAKAKRQSLQRSSSVNSELASRYLGSSLSINTAGGGYGAKAATDCNATFAMPTEQNHPIENNNDVFVRNYVPMSASAPQSPLINYSPNNANPFNFKMRANSFEGPTTQLLLEEILRCRQESNGDQFMGSNVDRGPKDASTLAAPNHGVQDATLSREVSQLFSDEPAAGGYVVPNFAQLQYRSQSVPLHRMNDGVPSSFAFSSTAANSMAPTPVPSEYQDFGSDMLLDSGEVNSDNLNQIFNLLDAQEDTQIKMDPDGQMGMDGNVQCLNVVELNEAALNEASLNEASLNEVALNDEKLQQTYGDTLLLQQSYGALVTENGGMEQHTTYVESTGMAQRDQISLGMEQDQISLVMAQRDQISLGMDRDQISLGMDRDQISLGLEQDQISLGGMERDQISLGGIDEQLSPSYENGPLPYKSSFEYVTDGAYRTYSPTDNACGARRNISVLLEPTFFTNEVNGVLPPMGDSDHVSQLEQQRDARQHGSSDRRLLIPPPPLHLKPRGSRFPSSRAQRAHSRTPLERRRSRVRRPDPFTNKLV